MLAAIWAAVLLPSLVRSRIAASPIDGVRNFENAMGILSGARARRTQNASGRWVMVPRDVTAPPRRRARVIERRRRMFTRLVSLVAVTLALGIVPSLRWVWFVNLAADAALAVYVSRLLRWKAEPAEPETARPGATAEETEPRAGEAEPWAGEALPWAGQAAEAPIVPAPAPDAEPEPRRMSLTG